MTFLQLVNRILRMNGQIRGDTDEIVAFTDTQHNAALNLAIVAGQDELADLLADRLIPYERTSNSVSLVTSTRAYALQTNFVRFYGVPHFYRAAENRQIYEYPGGLEQLQVDVFNFATQYGDPNWWYFEPTTTKQVGFFPVPTSAENGEAWTYEYEKEITLTLIADVIPLHNDSEGNAFAQMAGRRFKFLFEDAGNKMDIQAVLDNDLTYKRAKARLVSLIRGTNPSKMYAHGYI